MLSISKEVEDEWDKDTSIVEWTMVEKKTKGKNKTKKKEGEKAPPTSMKRGPKPKGDIF